MNLVQRLSLCWRILRADSTSSLMQHANRELPPDDIDEMQGLMNQDLRELVLVFSTQGHSGMPAGCVRGALDKLLSYAPLRPLTGEPSEWIDHGGGVLQNNRCSTVFKSPERFGGQAYKIDAVVFVEPNGCRYTSRDSHRPVVFPYTPKTEYVNVDFEGNPR